MQALALKYRPRNFDELIGQTAVSKSLTHALSEGRIGHAYLFSGLRGSGKTSSARIFSKALVCDHGPTPRPCEVCPNCIMANENRHMDIIEMDAASHRKIDDIRELIEQTKYAPACARYKIFIIDEVHMLTKEAFNALLKTLEEPPEYVKFILATTDPLKLPTTVLSRTQHFRFKQISKFNVVKHLQFILSKEGIEYENEALEILARTGSGSLRDTLTLLDQAIIYGTDKITQANVASMLGLLDPSRIEEILATVINLDRQKLCKIIAELENYDPEMIIDELIANLKEKFLSSNMQFSLLVYERFFRILAQAKGMLNTTSDNAFVLSIMLFMMMEALNFQNIDDAINETKKQSTNSNVSTNESKKINPNLMLNPQDQSQNSNKSQNLSDFSKDTTINDKDEVINDNAKNLGDLNKKTIAKKENLNNDAEILAHDVAAIAVKQSEKSSQKQESEEAKNSQNDLEFLAQKEKYENFLSKIYDRDYELGECFKRSVKFVSFKNYKLSLISPADGDDREMLIQKFAIINGISKEIFGKKTLIVVQKIDEQDSHEAKNSDKQEFDSKKDENSQKGDFIQNVQNDANIQGQNTQENTSEAKDQISNEQDKNSQKLNEQSENLDIDLGDELDFLKANKAMPKVKSKTKQIPSLLDLNNGKSENQLEIQRQNSILKEASALFGEPRIEQ